MDTSIPGPSAPAPPRNSCPSCLKNATTPPEPKLDPVEITDEYAARLLGYYADDMRNAPSGGSNMTLYVCALKAGKLVSAGKISYSDAVQALRIAAQARVKPEKRGGIMPTIKSGLDAGVRST